MTTTPTTKQNSKNEVAAALAAHPGATAAELAKAAGVGRSTAAKCLVALEHEGRVRRTSGGRGGGRRLADRWTAVEAEAPTGPPTLPDGDGRDEEVESAEPAESGAGRLGKGALRSLVFQYLAANTEDDPDADGLSPTAIAKALDRSSGAVGNALLRLEAEGKVRMIHESPRRYRLTNG